MAKERALNGLKSWMGDRPMTVQHIFSLSLKNLIKDYIIYIILKVKVPVLILQSMR